MSRIQELSVSARGFSTKAFASLHLPLALTKQSTILRSKVLLSCALGSKKPTENLYLYICIYVYTLGPKVGIMCIHNIATITIVFAGSFYNTQRRHYREPTKMMILVVEGTWSPKCSGKPKSKPHGSGPALQEVGRTGGDQCPYGVRTYSMIQTMGPWYGPLMYLS